MSDRDDTARQRPGQQEDADPQGRARNGRASRRVAFIAHRCGGKAYTPRRQPGPGPVPAVPAMVRVRRASMPPQQQQRRSDGSSSPTPRASRRPDRRGIERPSARADRGIGPPAGRAAPLPGRRTPPHRGGVASTRPARGRGIAARPRTRRARSRSRSRQKAEVLRRRSAAPAAPASPETPAVRPTTTRAPAPGRVRSGAASQRVRRRVRQSGRCRSCRRPPHPWPRRYAATSRPCQRRRT